MSILERQAINLLANHVLAVAAEGSPAAKLSASGALLNLKCLLRSTDLAGDDPIFAELEAKSDCLFNQALAAFTALTNPQEEDDVRV